MTFNNSVTLSQKQLEDIASTSLFCGCSIDKVHNIINTYGYFEKFAKNEYIFDMHSKNKRLCILISGEALAIRKNGEKEVILNHIHENMLFGFASVFCEYENYISLIKASKNSTVLCFDEDKLTLILKENFNITQNYIRYLTKRVCFLNNKINSFIEPLPEVRVASFIYDEYKKSHEPNIYANATKIADILNISRQTLYRAFDTLENEEIIKKQYKFIEVINPDKLEQFIIKNKKVLE